jgi:nitroimidazol reductase NimA-like FMN-containing flavoprotein (pyridoxamine 5'-phosphate oxidase superfamily)
MSRREQIRMSAAEAAEFLAEERTVTCATVGPRGWPHLMPLWYVLRDGGDGPSPRLWAWTYGASQKTLNLERDPRATLQIEAGESYEELRGVMLECDAIVHRELDVVTALGEAVMLRNSVPRGGEQAPALPSEGRAVIAAQAVKRVALEFVERRRTTWDHRKLGGIY